MTSGNLLMSFPTFPDLPKRPSFKGVAARSELKTYRRALQFSGFSKGINQVASIGTR